MESHESLVLGTHARILYISEQLLELSDLDLSVVDDVAPHARYYGGWHYKTFATLIRISITINFSGNDKKS